MKIFIEINGPEDVADVVATLQDLAKGFRIKLTSSDEASIPGDLADSTDEEVELIEDEPEQRESFDMSKPLGGETTKEETKKDRRVEIKAELKVLGCDMDKSKASTETLEKKLESLKAEKAVLQADQNDFLNDGAERVQPKEPEKKYTKTDIRQLCQTLIAKKGKAFGEEIQKALRIQGSPDGTLTALPEERYNIFVKYITELGAKNK